MPTYNPDDERDHPMNARETTIRIEADDTPDDIERKMSAFEASLAMERRRQRYNPDDHERGHPMDTSLPPDTLDGGERERALAAVIATAREIAGSAPRKQNSTAYAALVPWQLIKNLRHAIDQLDEAS